MKHTIVEQILSMGCAATLGTAAMLMVSLTGCSQSSAPAATTAAPATEAPATEAPATEAPAAETPAAETGSVKGALEGVKLSFCTSGLFAPFTYYDTDGKTLIGFDLDFEKALEDYLGFEMDGEVQAMDYTALTSSIATSKIDFGMSALCATDERKKVMNFTETYYDSGQILAINTETSPKELESVDQLTSGDYTVAVEKGTASHLYVMNAGVPESAIQVHDEVTTAYEALEQGKVDCLIQDQPGMAYYIKTVEGTKLAMTGEEFNQGQAPYAIPFSNDCVAENPEIVEIFNQAVQDLIADGTFDELAEKWLK